MSDDSADSTWESSGVSVIRKVELASDKHVDSAYGDTPIENNSTTDTFTKYCEAYQHQRIWQAINAFTMTLGAAAVYYCSGARRVQLSCLARQCIVSDNMRMRTPTRESFGAVARHAYPGQQHDLGCQ